MALTDIQERAVATEGKDAFGVLQAVLGQFCKSQHLHWIEPLHYGELGKANKS